MGCGSICAGSMRRPCARWSRPGTGSPAADEARLVTYLEQHAEGNPFFATELLRALEEEALLRRDGDRWMLGELDRSSCRRSCAR